MKGILAVGAHIPVYRLGGDIVYSVWGAARPGERAVANWDEDSVTMAVQAGMDCLTGAEPGPIDALYFASTTAPYGEKQSASIVAAALDLRDDVFTADIGNSLRSGMIALSMAFDAVKSGRIRRALVIASDSRVPPPDSAFELAMGDGAAAVLVGAGDVVADLENDSHLSSEIIDVWRPESDKTVHFWEDRFIAEEGYLKYLPKAVSNLMSESRLKPEDVAKVAFCSATLNPRDATRITEKLGFDAKTQLQPSVATRAGNSGAASALTALLSMLEQAKPGDRVLLAEGADGASAHVFRTTEAIETVREKRSIGKQIESRRMLDNYGRYIKFKNLIDSEESIAYRPRSSPPQTQRNSRLVYGLYGHKCRKCGKVQYPLQKFCIYCQAGENELEEVRLAERKGSLFTYSIDERAPFVSPPNVLAAVNLENGGRFYSQLTDVDVKDLKVGMPVELTFRRIFKAQGICNYFWKCRPVRY